MFCFCTELWSHLLPWSKLLSCLLWAWFCPLRAPSTPTPPASSDLASVSLNLAAALPTPPLKLVWNLSIRKLKCNVLANTGCPRKNSLITFFLNDFPTDVDYRPTFSWTVKHPWRPGHSLKKVAGRPLASDQVSSDKVCGWSVGKSSRKNFIRDFFLGHPVVFLISNYQHEN